MKLTWNSSLHPHVNIRPLSVPLQRRDVDGSQQFHHLLHDGPSLVTPSELQSQGPEGAQVGLHYQVKVRDVCLRRSRREVTNVLTQQSATGSKKYFWRIFKKSRDELCIRWIIEINSFCVSGFLSPGFIQKEGWLAFFSTVCITAPTRTKSYPLST